MSSQYRRILLLLFILDLIAYTLLCLIREQLLLTLCYTAHCTPIAHNRLTFTTNIFFSLSAVLQEVMCMAFCQVAFAQLRFFWDVLFGPFGGGLFGEGLPSRGKGSGVSRISFRGGFTIFWKSGGICMARSARQRVASPRVC